ncbi:MAG: accessory factor UbiK family protein [Alphaproteobacteria bacterium]|nr:accessory factor UbiK family protein [Alphaproteobacteria bacterium]
MKDSGKILDDLGRLMNEAAGVMDGVRREIETVVKSQVERMVGDLELVKREDHDVLKDMIRKQGARIDGLQEQLDALSAVKKPGTKKSG